VCLERISRRRRETYESNAVTPEAYYKNKAAFEPVALKPLKTAFPELQLLHVVVDTTPGRPEQWQVREAACG
jgi:hypothetical protein